MTAGGRSEIRKRPASAFAAVASSRVIPTARSMSAARARRAARAAQRIGATSPDGDRVKICRRRCGRDQLGPRRWRHAASRVPRFPFSLLAGRGSWRGRPAHGRGAVHGVKAPTTRPAPVIPDGRAKRGRSGILPPAPAPRGRTRRTIPCQRRTACCAAHGMTGGSAVRDDGLVGAKRHAARK